MSQFDFAAIGINHNHIYGQVDAMLDAGAEFVAFHAAEDDLARPFAETLPAGASAWPTSARSWRIRRSTWSSAPPSRPTGRRWPSRPCGTARTYMTDKPGMITLEQLAEVQPRAGRDRADLLGLLFRALRAARDRRRRASWSRPAPSARSSTRSASARTGSTRPRGPTGSSSARAMAASSPTSPRTSVEQFLFFTGADERRGRLGHGRATAANPRQPGLAGFRRHALLRAESATGYIRVDWFTPDGLPTWGDGRLVHPRHRRLRSSCASISTSPAGPATTTCSSSTARASQHIDCSAGRAALRPAARRTTSLNRTETAMPQAQCFMAMELALTAQALAERGIGRERK